MADKDRAGSAGDVLKRYKDVAGDGSFFAEEVYVAGGGTSGTQYAEDAAHVSGDLGTMALGVRSDTAAATAGTTGDYQPVIFDATGRMWVHVGAIDAGTALIGAIAGANDTATVYAGAATAITPKFAKIDAAGSGNNTLVAAVTSKKVRVIGLFLVCSAAVTVKFQSGAGGTDLTGAMSFAANGGISLPHNVHGYFETAAATLLNMSLGGAQQVSGGITYLEV